MNLCPRLSACSRYEHDAEANRKPLFLLADVFIMYGEIVIMI
jgi:hypothetical protein